VTVHDPQLVAGKTVLPQPRRAKMNADKNGLKQQARALAEAIEVDNETIAKLLRSCGSSQQFGPEQQHQFEKLMKRRRQLITKLQGLRGENDSR
jgi:hypothetical protein